MLRPLLAALATTGAIAQAQWSNPDLVRTKSLTQQLPNRRHSLAEQHQKGNEKKNRALNDKKIDVPSNEGLQSIRRMLKRTRESAGTGKTGGRADAKVKRGGSDELVKRTGPVADDDSTITIDARSNPSWGNEIYITAAYAKSQKSVPAPAKSPAKSPSNGGKRPGSSPSTPTPLTPDEESKSGKTGKTGKSRKVTSGVCTKRLMIAFEQIVALGKDGPFGTIETPSDVTELCAFVPPEEDSDDFNFGCPFLFIPTMGFLEGQEEYIALLGEEAGTAFNSLVLYCQCHQGFDLGCAAKIPHGPPTSTTEYDTGEVLVNGYSEFIPFSDPAERADYCKMVGVWNGDFDEDVAQEFSPDVVDCGCFFTGTAKDMVGTCPGVELGAFFEFPNSAGDSSDDSSDEPTAFPTDLPTMDQEPTFTFFDSFEDGDDFPGENYSLSNGDIGSRRRLQEGSDFARTTDEAFDGSYSIMSPDLSNDDFTPRLANLTLTVGEEFGTPGILSFAAIGALEDDFFVLIVDDEVRINDIFGFEWDTYEEYLGPGSHEVTWVYLYNPLEVADPGSGSAFLDKVTLTPSTQIPTFLPTTAFPSYSPTV